ncbi:MAG: PAS domain-containing protein [Nitriliruptoraceae bacterium]
MSADEQGRGGSLHATPPTPRSDRVESEQRSAPYLDVTALDLGGDIVFITDADGTIVDVNDAFVRVTGYSKREAIGSKPSILSSGYQDERFYADLWRTISSGQVWEGQLVDRRRDGALRTHQATISPVQDEAGRITHYVAVQRDVTTELGRQGAVGSTGLVHTDLTGRCVYADARSAALLGCHSSELLGPGFLACLEAADADALREVIQMAAELGREHRLDVRTRRGAWLHVEVAPLLVASGSVIGAVCGVEDVAEQVSVHRELARRDAFVGSVLDALDDAVAIIDADGTVAAVNRAWLSVSGQRPADALLATRVGDDLKAAVRRAIDAGDDQARTFGEELHRVLSGMSSEREHGTRFQITPLRTDDGGAVLRLIG